jgi:hypothetical protein
VHHVPPVDPILGLGLRLEGARRDAQRVAELLLREARVVHGQALWSGRVHSPGSEFSDESALGLLATHRLRGLAEPARLAVVGLARGTHHARVEERPFTAREVLALQAEGRRCVSLMPPGAPLGPYPSAFAFAAHDLDHLAQLFDPLHFAGQLGFFRMLHEGVETGMAGLFERHDPKLVTDIETVGADTNGSAVFAFASLVMKLKMATRRRFGRTTGILREKGPLSEDEERAFEPDFEALCAVFRLGGTLPEAARLVGTRREHKEAGLALLGHFEGLGKATKTEAPSSDGTRETE